MKARVFCGNPGVGKSTLLNGIVGGVNFSACVSVTGGGITSEAKTCEKDGIIYVDTPGLDDAVMKDQAAAEIQKGLQMKEIVKGFESKGGVKEIAVFFVVHLNAGRVSASDAATILTVMKALPQMTHVNIIINKVSAKMDKAFKAAGGIEPIRQIFLQSMSHAEPGRDFYVNCIRVLENKDLTDDDNVEWDVRSHEPGLLVWMDLAKTFPVGVSAPVKAPNMTPQASAPSVPSAPVQKSSAFAPICQKDVPQVTPQASAPSAPSAPVQKSNVSAPAPQASAPSVPSAQVQKSNVSAPASQASAPSVPSAPVQKSNASAPVQKSNASTVQRSNASTTSTPSVPPAPVQKSNASTTSNPRSQKEYRHEVKSIDLDYHKKQKENLQENSWLLSAVWDSAKAVGGAAAKVAGDVACAAGTVAAVGTYAAGGVGLSYGAGAAASATTAAALTTVGVCTAPVLAPALAGIAAGGWVFSKIFG